jgi:phage tail-like protein
MAEYLPTVRSNFKVEIDGTDFGNFLSVSGLGSSADVVEFIGGMDKNAKKRTSKVKYETLVLKRCSDPRNPVLRKWWSTVEKGTPEKKAVSIVFMDESGSEEIIRRNCFECLPVGWSMDELNAQESGSIIETLQVAYEDAKWDPEG